MRDEVPVDEARDGTILVVDDDESIRGMVGQILESEGYRVAVAENGRVGIDLTDRLRPALVLLDMRMPVLDGWGYARELAARRIRVPVVVMTAAANAREWARQIAAADCLAKPFELDQLLDIAERYVRRGA